MSPYKEKHESRVNQVEQYMHTHSCTAAKACKALSIAQPTYYSSLVVLGKNKGAKKKPGRQVVQTIAAEPIREASTKLVCLIGDAREIAKVLSL